MTDLGDFEPGTEPTSDADSEPEPTGEEPAFEPVDATPRGRDRGLGTLSAAEGLSVGEEEDDTRLRAYVTVGNRSLVRVGRYAIADYPDDEALFCRISALEYAQEFESDDATEIHARRAMRNDGIDEADYKLMATLEPLAVLYSEGGELRRRMADRVPKPETVVRQAEDKVEVKTGLKVPDDGVFIGHLAVGGEKIKTAAEPPTVDYRLQDDYDSGDPLVFRHSLIAGGTGSGKTHASKNILRQYLGRTYEMSDGRTPGAAVVQFDPQDEYAQMHDDGDYPDDFARKLDAEGVKHGGHADTKAFVPAVGGATYAADHHRAEQVAFTLPFSMVESRPWLVAGAGLNDNQYQGLTNLLDRFFRQHGNEGTYARFRSFLDDPALREELHEGGQIHEATFDAVKRKTQGFGDIFDGDAPHHRAGPRLRPTRWAYLRADVPHQRYASDDDRRVGALLAARGREALERPPVRPHQGDAARAWDGRGAQLPHRRRQRTGRQGHLEVLRGGKTGPERTARLILDHPGPTGHRRPRVQAGEHDCRPEPGRRGRHQIGEHPVDAGGKGAVLREGTDGHLLAGQLRAGGGGRTATLCHPTRARLSRR